MEAAIEPVERNPDEMVTKSAPGSPQSPRLLLKPSMKPATGSISPVSPKFARALDRRRGSEPVAVLSRTNGVRFPRTGRRDAVLTADLFGDSRSPTSSPIMYRRGKSRYVHLRLSVLSLYAWPLSFFIDPSLQMESDKFSPH